MGKNDAYWAGFSLGRNGGKYNASGYTDEEELAWYKKGYNAGSNGYFVTEDSDGKMVNGDGTSTFVNTQNNDDGMDAVFKIIDQYSKPDYTPFTGGGFADFLKQYGNENARAYSEGVRGANAAFYRSLMNYGKNAEMLGANGLSSSGVSDYGNAAAYAARQGAVTELGKARLQADTDAMGEYTGRISAANAEGKAQAQAMANAKVQGLLSAIQSGIVDEASARIIAQQAGVYDEEEIDKFVGAITAYGKSQQSKTETANSETLFANTQSLFDNFIANGFTPEQAKAKVEQYAQQMPSAYNAELIDSIYNTHVNVQNMGKSDAPNVAPDDTVAAATEEYNNLINQGVTPKAAADIINKNHGFDLGTTLMGDTNTTFESIVKNGIDTMLNNGYSPFGGENQYSVAKIKQAINTGEISEAAGNAQIERIQNANLEWVNNMLGKSIDPYNVDRALAELEVSGEGLDAETKLKTAYDVLNERVKKLVVSGEMSEEKAAEYYVKYFDANFEENSDIENIMASLMTFKNKIGYLGQDGEGLAYQKALEIIVENKNVGGLYAGTEFIAFDDNATSNSELSRIANGYCFSIKQGNVKDFNGKPKIGSFKIGETTITLYDKGMFSLNTSNYPGVDYIVGLKPSGIYDNGSRKKFDKDDRKAMGEIAEDILYAWMLKQCGK